MASNRICLLASSRQSRPSKVRSGQEAEDMETLKNLLVFDLSILTSGLHFLFSSSFFFLILFTPATPSFLLTLLLAHVLHLLLSHLAEQGHPLQGHHLQSTSGAAVCTHGGVFCLWYECRGRWGGGSGSSDLAGCQQSKQPCHGILWSNDEREW